MAELSKKIEFKGLVGFVIIDIAENITVKGFADGKSAYSVQEVNRKSEIIASILKSAEISVLHCLENTYYANKNILEVLAEVGYEEVQSITVDLSEFAGTYNLKEAKRVANDMKNKLL